MPRPTIPRPVSAVAFAAAVGGWTVLLLLPKPVPEVVLQSLDWFDREMLRFLLAKALHLTVYAALAYWGGGLFPAGRRWPVYVGLALHGVATEVGQMYVPNRFGTVRDMLVDAAGIAIGTLLLGRFRPARVAFPDTPDEGSVGGG